MKINVSNSTKPQQATALRTLPSGVYLCGQEGDRYLVLWDKVVNVGYTLGRNISGDNIFAGINTVTIPVPVKIDSIDVSVI